jgi:hypothetical protein
MSDDIFLSAASDIGVLIRAGEFSAKALLPAQ